MIPSVSLKPLHWHPYIAPVEIEAATPAQLEAMKVTPSNQKISEYVRTLVHDPESYVARTALFNVEGGLNRADALGARDAAIYRFARHLSATPSEATPDDVAALRAVGINDQEIIVLIHAIAIFGWANRLMHVLGHADLNNAVR